MLGSTLHSIIGRQNLPDVRDCVSEVTPVLLQEGSNIVQSSAQELSRGRIVREMQETPRERGSASKLSRSSGTCVQRICANRGLRHTHCATHFSTSCRKTVPSLLVAAGLC